MLEEEEGDEVILSCSCSFSCELVQARCKERGRRGGRGRGRGEEVQEGRDKPAGGGRRREVRQVGREEECRGPEEGLVEEGSVVRRRACVGGREGGR